MIQKLSQTCTKEKYFHHRHFLSIVTIHYNKPHLGQSSNETAGLQSLFLFTMNVKLLDSIDTAGSLPLTNDNEAAPYKI